jgi:hypothetical protein
MSSHCNDPRIRPLPGLGFVDDPSNLWRQEIYENSVFHVFELRMLPVLPMLALQLSSRRHSWNGRRSKDLVTMIGLYLIQDLLNWTGAKAVEALVFHPFLHRALGLPANPSREESHVCEKTYYTFRENFLAVDGPWLAWLSVTFHLLKTFGVDVTTVRLDSSKVQSNIKVLTRCGLIRETVSLFLMALGRERPGLYRELDRALRARNSKAEKDGRDPYAQASLERRKEMLILAARDAEALVGRFRHDPAAYPWTASGPSRGSCASSARGMPRADGGEPGVTLREAGDVAADSLQSPCDTGATYSGAKRMRAARSRSRRPAPRPGRAGWGGPR